LCAIIRLTANFSFLPHTCSREKDLRLAFDCVLPANSTQDDVYQNTAKRLVSSVMEGYNASCFAYGATGAGKTCTMIGNEIVGPGVMVLTMRDIFDQVCGCFCFALFASSGSWRGWET
jgi:kinesin family protein 18/19